ncbi:hypothetical protein ACH5RR_000728 [Cinchona calisaya]|uniref:Uncharacterized protein n=1 Tax=Cinchona calisaya TaxID=153742 RepID=A0ABD3B1E6_9GENT
MADRMFSILESIRTWLDTLASQTEIRLNVIKETIDVVDTRMDLLKQGTRLVMNEEKRANYSVYEQAKRKQPITDPMEYDVINVSLYVM